MRDRSRRIQDKRKRRQSRQAKKARQSVPGPTIGDVLESIWKSAVELDSPGLIGQAIGNLPDPQAKEPWLKDGAVSVFFKEDLHGPERTPAPNFGDEIYLGGVRFCVDRVIETEDHYWRAVLVGRTGRLVLDYDDVTCDEEVPA